MKRQSWILLGVVCLPTLIAQGPVQTDTQFGDFLFKAPLGWTQRPAGNTLAFEAPPAIPGTSTSLVLASYGIDTDLRTSFTKAWQALQTQYRVQQSGQVLSQRLPGGNEALCVSALADDPQGKHWAAMFLMAQNGSRSELVLFATDDLRPAALATYRGVLAAFLATVHFQGPGPVTGGQPAAAPVAMPAGTGKLAGIYRAATRDGIDPTATLDLFDPARKTPEYSFLTFFPDGRIKRGLIGNGFDGYVADSFFRHDIANGGHMASQWGVYQVAGAGGRIVFADPRLAGQQLVSGLRGEVQNFGVYPDRLQIQGDTYYLLDCGNGLKLQGIYKPSGDTSQPGIKFTADGEFVDEGILDTRSSTAIGLVGGGVAIGYGFDSPRAGRGRYRITNYSLHLNYTNGKLPSPLFYIEPGSSRENVQTLYIGNVKYQLVR
jgi:hypothetical protein